MVHFPSKSVWLMFGLLFILPSTSFAKMETIYATHKYVMGDNDSKNDARRMCFLEAKRRALEKAGTYIESLTEVKNARLTRDEIFAYSAALLKVDTIKEKWKLAGENMAVIITVKANVDTSHILKELAKIRGDTSVQKKIISQQRRLKDLEGKVVNLQRQLGAVDASKAATLRKNRNVIFKQIDELEAKKIAIMSRIKAKTIDVVKYIERGMIPGEVKSLVGEPRSIDYFLHYNYGTVWVIFNSGVVNCIVRVECFEGARNCNMYTTNCIVK